MKWYPEWGQQDKRTCSYDEDFRYHDSQKYLTLGFPKLETKILPEEQ